MAGDAAEAGDTPEPSIVRLVREGALDAELAALLWLLVEGGLPIVVCGPPDAGRRREVLAALLALPRGSGSRGDRADTRADAASHTGAHTTVLKATPWTPTLSARILALKPGEPFAAVVDADSLLDLLAQVTAPTGGLSDDEARALGLVVVVDADGRIDAVHLLRPVEVDAAGHHQRRPPAVLASRDPRSGDLDHFSWGVLAELSDRVDRSQADLERRVADRAAVIQTLAVHGAPTTGDPQTERSILADAHAAEPPREPAPERPPARQDGPPAPPHVH